MGYIIKQFNPLDIAGWLINKGIDVDRCLTNLVINKLSYFAHGFSYRINKSPLIVTTDYFEAWQYGPVSPVIYHQYKHNGNSKIKERIEINNMPIDSHRYLSDFWNNFAHKYDAVQLVSMAHAEGGAWDRTRKEGQSIIPHEYIEQEFTKPRH